MQLSAFKFLLATMHFHMQEMTTTSVAKDSLIYIILPGSVSGSGTTVKKKYILFLSIHTR